MKLNTNGKIIRFYKWVLGIEDEELDKTLCPLFWKLILVLLFFPLIILKKKLDDYEPDEIVIYTIENICIGMVILLSASLIKAIIEFPLILIALIQLIAIAVIVSFVFTLGTIIILIIKDKDSRGGDNILIESGYIAFEMTKGIKEKYCPVINWENK